jgi:hypothetical protein
MHRSSVFIILLFISFQVFAQQSGVRVFGTIPDPADSRLFRIQVGAFQNVRNAEAAYARLMNVWLEPSYETYLDFTRVVVKGIRAGDVPLYILIIKNAGFSDVFVQAEPGPPVSTAELPPAELREIGYRSVKVGETKSLADIVTGRRVASWRSSTPSTVRVDTYGNITGLRIGNGFISINETEYISVAVVPAESFYPVPEYEVAMLPENSRAGNSSSNLTEYRTEPTFRLSYRFNNKGEERGASGENGGIDILARGPDYEWLWTTYYQGGWFYDLNGIKREMVNGYQRDPYNGVELTIKPEFVYDSGVPYLQLRHILHNPGYSTVTGQRFGASADVMIHQNDGAPLFYTDYGAYMTDSLTNPSLELLFVCEEGYGMPPVDTLWLGRWDDGDHLEYIYDDERSDISGVDSAIGFSYQDIYLAPGETKEFIVRFTLARTED